MNEKYKFGNSYHLNKIKEAFCLNYKTFIGLLLSSIVLCYENVFYGIFIYIFCTHLTYFVHIMAHLEESKILNKIHEYHHNNNDFYAHYTQIFLEISTGIVPLIIVYLLTGRVYIKYKFEPYVIFMFSYFYSSIHNINYSLHHVNKIHSNHHDNWSINYGPDILDVIYGTKENYEELENTDHYLPNLLICTLGIKAIQILLNKIDIKYKKIFFTYLITTYGGIMAFLFVFNLNLIYLDNLNKELMSTQIKLEKIYNKIKNK